MCFDKIAFDAAKLKKELVALWKEGGPLLVNKPQIHFVQTLVRILKCTLYGKILGLRVLQQRQYIDPNIRSLMHIAVANVAIGFTITF